VILGLLLVFLSSRVWTNVDRAKPPGLCIEVAAGDRPRWREARCQLQQADIAHVGPPQLTRPGIEPGDVLAAVKDAAPLRDGLWPSYP
jgi:hypothetical protein